jgi:hypothetical protein
MSSNTLDIHDRIAVGKMYERQILEKLQASEVVVEGKLLSEFVPATREDDMHNKIDAWCFAQGSGLDGKSVQIKYRETGSDLGVAVWRPYRDEWTLRDCVKRDIMQWDRDFMTIPDYYAYGVGDLLIVAPGYKVKAACTILLNKAMNEGFTNNMYEAKTCPGAQLRVVTDKGQGYSYGQKKIICYITPWLLKRAGSWVGSL